MSLLTLAVTLERVGDAHPLPALVWRAGPGWRMTATTAAGGGLGPRGWVVNVQVPHGYARLDPDVHVAELAAAAGLHGPGVGMLTAAPVAAATRAADGGVEALATVGLGRPTWAAAPDELQAWQPGTVNLIVAVPVPLSDGALVNAVATATEAKVQALLECGWACTGTASDAVCVAALAAPAPAGTAAAPPGPACPGKAPGHTAGPFAGPRSRWGARLARAVHAAVSDGARCQEIGSG